MSWKAFVRRGLAVAVLGAALAAMPALAEKYPSRSVTLVVPFAAGTALDVTTRMLAEHLSGALGQPFVVENKPGGGGTVGSFAVARAQPDGHTLVVITNGTHSAAHALYKNVPYDPIKDFTPVARFANFISLVVVNPKLSANTIGDLVAHAKANPGKLEYAYGNSSAQVIGETLKSQAGLDMVRVAYRGNPQAMNDVIAGHVRVAVTDLSTAMPQIRANKIRPLAVASGQRTGILPDVPTLNETVMPGFDVVSWFALAGPAGLPREAVDVLAKELKAFAARKDIRDKLATMGAEAAWTGPDEIPAFMNAELAKWTRLIKAAGIEPE